MAYTKTQTFGRTTNGSSTSAHCKPVKAKCVDNQSLVDALVAKRSTLGSNNYSRTLRKATESLAKQKEAVQSYAQAKALSGIGDHVANLLFPAAKLKSAESPASSVGSTKSTASRSRPRNILPTADPVEKPSAREIAYQNAVQHATAWKSLSLTWRAVLLIDQRETQSDHVIAKCRMSGIPCEARSLPIGDMAWMAQGMDTAGKIKAELMLGTIVERKTVDDLKASLFGTRYNEQQLRLMHSGLPQVLFLIEGDLTKDLRGCSVETMHTATWEIRLHKDFQILQTAHLDETVQTLKRMHRRVLQRSFPRAFVTQALPTFSETDTSVNDKQAKRRSTDQAAPRKNRRRRLQSLMEMMFDVDPTPMPGTERFITYAELKAKVEYDRELGTRTIGSIHSAMLKQVQSFSDRKVQALCRTYSTANELFLAYESVNDVASKKALVTELPISDPSSHQLRKTGPKSAEELYTVYGMDEGISPPASISKDGTKPSLTAAWMPSPIQEEDDEDLWPNGDPNVKKYVESQMPFTSIDSQPMDIPLARCLISKSAASEQQPLSEVNIDKASRSEAQDEDLGDAFKGIGSSAPISSVCKRGVSKPLTAPTKAVNVDDYIDLLSSDNDEGGETDTAEPFAKCEKELDCLHFSGVVEQKAELAEFNIRSPAPVVVSQSRASFTAPSSLFSSDDDDASVFQRSPLRSKRKPFSAVGNSSCKKARFGCETEQTRTKRSAGNKAASPEVVVLD